MLKGKVKIQLFNAESGEEEKVIESENMVTNAINYLLNPPIDHIALATTPSYNALCQQFAPLYSKGLHGVLCWDDTIEENPDIVHPPHGTRCTAHAGTSYSGAMAKRGTFNEAESGYIDNEDGSHNGYRYVWDFGTDKGNGTIKCVSLTHSGGGDVGYDEYDQSVTPNNSYNAGASNTNSMSLCRPDSSYGRHMPLSDGSYVCKNNSVGFYGTKYQSFIRCDTAHMDNVGIFDTISKDSFVINEPATRVDFTDCTNSGSSNTQIYTYNDKIHATVLKLTSGTTTLYHAVVDPDTYEIESQKNITLSGLTLTTLGYAVYCNDAYYVTNKNSDREKGCLSKFDADGKFVKHIIDDAENDFVGCTFNGTSAIQVFSDGEMNVWNWFVKDDKVYWCNLFGNSGTAQEDFIRDKDNPLYGYKLQAATYGHALFQFLNYLATINNLPEAVTKTNEQTMKITYEVTQEG
ncbi:MAG: hypothetical protein J1E39_03150 [Eubacterium sp.]|nr:hypothetical protein [Eubacterium sp.]